MGDWTPQERRIKTPYGYIRYGGPCKDNYANMVTYDQGGGHTVIEFQRPAMEAWLAAQVRYAKRSGWDKRRIENTKIKIGGKIYLEGKPIGVIPGTNRTCATQARLYASDHSRYAPPQYTGHTRGLSADVGQEDLKVKRECLEAEGWHWARSDEPWHCSFHVSI